MRDDPAGFLGFVEELLAAKHFDVLLPIHEQGFLFARVRQRLEDRVGLALPSFPSYRTAHSKAGFSRLLDQLGLPKPAARIVKSASELRDAVRFPCVVKTSVGTAAAESGLCATTAIWMAPCKTSARTARSPMKCWCRNWSRARPRRRKPCFAAANCLDFMHFGKLPPGPVAARRSNKALAGSTCARSSRPLEKRSEERRVGKE